MGLFLGWNHIVRSGRRNTFASHSNPADCDSLARVQNVDGNWSRLLTVIKLMSKLINAAMIHWYLPDSASIIYFFLPTLYVVCTNGFACPERGRLPPRVPILPLLSKNSINEPRFHAFYDVALACIDSFRFALSVPAGTELLFPMKRFWLYGATRPRLAEFKKRVVIHQVMDCVRWCSNDCFIALL